MQNLKKPREYIYKIVTANPMSLLILDDLEKNATHISCQITGETKGKTGKEIARNDPQNLGYTMNPRVVDQYPAVKLCTGQKAKYNYEFKVQQGCPADILKKKMWIFWRYVIHVKMESAHGNSSLDTDIQRLAQKLESINNFLQKERPLNLIASSPSSNWDNDLLQVLCVDMLLESDHKVAQGIRQKKEDAAKIAYNETLNENRVYRKNVKEWVPKIMIFAFILGFLLALTYSRLTQVLTQKII